MKEILNRRVPLCVGMPVKMGAGPYWKIVGYNEDWMPIIERPCKFFGYNLNGEALFRRLKEGEKPDRLTVPSEAVTPVDNLPWSEEVVGGDSIPRFGFSALEADLDAELEYLNKLYGPLDKK